MTEKNKMRPVTILLPESTYKKMRQRSLDYDLTIQHIVASAIEKEVLLKDLKKED